MPPMTRGMNSRRMVSTLALSSASISPFIFIKATSVLIAELERNATNSAVINGSSSSTSKRMDTSSA